MDVWQWLADNILPAILLAMGGIFYRRFDILADSVSSISSKLGVFQAHMDNTNSNIKTMIDKMDKLDDHENSITLLVDHDKQKEGHIREINERIRNLEHAKTSNGRR